MSNYTTQTYVGVADCHGIESFNLKENTDAYDRTCSIMRAAANGQRHAIYYEANIEREHVGVVKAYLKEKQWANALECLKRVAVEFSVLPEQEEVLHKIPNPKLDPYG